MSVKTMPLVGGCVCLDFVNTSGARQRDAPRERLLSYEDLIVWGRRARCIDAAAGARLRRRAAARPREAAAALPYLHRVRETLYRVLRAVAQHDPVPDEDLARLSGWWREERQQRELVPTRTGFALRFAAIDTALDGVRWPVIASAVELLTEGKVERLRRCGECDWLFLDTSKNGTRTWCKTLCGDRARARRHYDRIRGRRTGPAREA